MEINPLNGINSMMPIDTAPKSREDADAMQAVVAAIRALNKSEMLGSDRELQFARDSQTQKMVIRIVERVTGNILNQIPPEQVLRIMATLVPGARKQV
jgi:uncharacterized FlaG/YvyC family protein